MFSFKQAAAKHRATSMALQGGSILIVDTAWQLKMETGSEEAGMLLAIQTGSSQAQNYFNGVAGREYSHCGRKMAAENGG